MARTVSRGEIVDMLRQWHSGILTAEQVHEWADGLYFPGLDFEDYESEEENSVANEVLSRLGMLNMNLIVAEDVPIYLEFLDTPRGQFARGYSTFEEALSQINYEDRRKKLAHSLLYAPFCRTP